MTSPTLAATLAALVLAVPCAAHAVGTHPHRFAFGEPAKAADATKTIHVEANDQMKLVFDNADIRRGEVVAFVVKNTGTVPHEFGIADEAGQAEHQREMASMPGMKHEDPNVVSLAPGETKTLVWRFDVARATPIVFACNVPGHYQAGMFTRLTVK